MPNNAFAAFTALLAITTLTSCGQGAVNGSINIAPGEKADSVTTVNGEINVGDGATVGSTTTVNGGVTLGANATAASVKTVNGEVKLGDSAKVSGSVVTVNGELLLGKGSDVTGNLANVNGMIHLVSAHVGGGISTANADIDISGSSRVEGGIHFEKPDLSIGTSKDQNPPRVVIGPGAVIEGPLTFERKVVLYISDGATVAGPIEGATAEKFAGEQPPG